MIQYGAISYAQAYDRVWVVDTEQVHHIVMIPYIAGAGRAVCGARLAGVAAITTLGKEVDGRTFCSGCLEMI